MPDDVCRWNAGNRLGRYCFKCGFGECKDYPMERTLTPDDTFPFVKIARDTGIPYGDVIRFAHEWEAIGEDAEWTVNRWQLKVIAAVQAERKRRAEGPWL